MRHPPIFVGGTGRSGTTIVGHLIGAGSVYYSPPFEAKFQTALPMVIAGNTTVDAFSRKMREFWYRRVQNGREYGMFVTVPRERVEFALREFAAAFENDRTAAARRLLDSIFEPTARENGKSAWLETTPSNMPLAPGLHAIVPEARFVHVIRDGRDVASSLVTKEWGPSGFVDSLYYWDYVMRLCSYNSNLYPRSQVLRVRFEDLVCNHREREYLRLLEFLELDDEPAMRQFFDQRMKPEGAKPGRWARDFTAEQRDEVNSLYSEMLRRQQADHIDGAPSPEEVEDAGSAYGSGSMLDAAARPGR